MDDEKEKRSTQIAGAICTVVLAHAFRESVTGRYSTSQK